MVTFFRGAVLSCTLALSAVGVGFIASCAPSTPPAESAAEAPMNEREDPAVSTLERIMVEHRRGGPPGQAHTASCVVEVSRTSVCEASRSDRLRYIPLRVALDPRYQQWPDWAGRLTRTFACVNSLYRPTGVQWDVSAVIPWDPGRERHDLYRLLDRLQREIQRDGESLRMGITVWDERRVYASSGGEIGLSQADACVVPSWPRIENDCLILTHELGHLTGAKHVPGKLWIMGWAASPFHLPAGDPLARVASLYRWHPRNLAAIRSYRSARITPLGLQPTPACRQELEELDRCYALP